MTTWRIRDERKREASNLVRRRQPTDLVLAGMEPNVEVSNPCRREGVNPVRHHAWKKRLLSSAARVFEDKRSPPNGQEQRREAEVQRLKNVIAVITTPEIRSDNGVATSRRNSGWCLARTA